jgi:hypothetical protein
MRFFAPDQEISPPIVPGDVFCWVHGPDVNNIYAMERQADGKDVVVNVKERFPNEIQAFFSRVPENERYHAR